MAVESIRGRAAQRGMRGSGEKWAFGGFAEFARSYEVGKSRSFAGQGRGGSPGAVTLEGGLLSRC